MKADDEGIRAVRDARKSISAEFAHDVTKLVEHYIQEQERYRERLLPTIAAQPALTADSATRRR